MSKQTRSAFRAGVLGGLPFVTVIVPFALLFGVVATEAGFKVSQTLAMSFLVIAGASQFVAVQLLADHAPTLIILASALAVNMRMAMYSAAMVPHLGPAPLWQRAFAAYLLVDQSYGVSIRRYEEDPPLSVPQKVAFFFGTIVVICPLWYAFTWIGAAVGTAIPPEYALDFAVPITFIALVAPQLKSLAHLAAALVAIAFSLALAWMPYSTGILVAGAAGMAAGAAVEIWLERRA